MLQTDTETRLCLKIEQICSLKPAEPVVLITPEILVQPKEQQSFELWIKLFEFGSVSSAG